MIFLSSGSRSFFFINRGAKTKIDYFVVIFGFSTQKKTITDLIELRKRDKNVWEAETTAVAAGLSGEISGEDHQRRSSLRLRYKFTLFPLSLDFD